MTKELIPRPLPAKARLHLALEENANLRTRIAAIEAKLAALSPAPEAQQEPVARPSEQAVTEAMVARALEEYICGDHDTPEQAMHAALKAAMEAGR